MLNPFDRLLLPERSVSAVLTDDLDAAWSQVQAWGDALTDGRRLVCCRWADIPSIDRLLDDINHAFAEIAFADWPCWYGGNLRTGNAHGSDPDLESSSNATAGQAETSFEQTLKLRKNLSAIARQQVRVAYPWLRRSAERCLRGELPFAREDNSELQAGQLALAICPAYFVVVLSVASTASESGAQTLAAAAEWLHRVTGAVAVILGPEDWRESPGLSRLWIAPEVLRFPPILPSPPSLPITHGPPFNHGPPIGHSSPIGHRSAAVHRPAVVNGLAVHAVEDCKAIVCLPDDTGSAEPLPRPTISATPLSGRPHPNSEAERILFDRITADAELAPLMAFNQSIRVELGQCYRIDILAAALKLAIEIDGPDHRSSAFKYMTDCERDYQLIKHGYLVLRLPNELVYCDPEQAVARMRDIVRYCKCGRANA